MVTPNVDHVVLAETDLRLRAAYEQAALSLVDGMPLVWLAAAMGESLPEKISGADFVLPLLARAASEGWRVYFLGGASGVGVRARDRLVAAMPTLAVVGIDAPPLGFERDPAERAAVLARLQAVRPHVVLMALGCPKQEVLMHEWREEMTPAVALGVGASLDFLAGIRPRAPRWLSRAGLEWAFRLVQEPRRLAGRYCRDRAIAGIAWRMLCLPHAERAYEVETREPALPVAELGAPAVRAAAAGEIAASRVKDVSSIPSR